MANEPVQQAFLCELAEKVGTRAKKMNDGGGGGGGESFLFHFYLLRSLIWLICKISHLILFDYMCISPSTELD